MSKIYVVTKGNYSDYHIIAATTDKNVADKIAKKFDGRYANTRVEVFENAEMYLRPLWQVVFAENGSVEEVFDHSNTEYFYDNVNEVGKRWDCKGVYVFVMAENAEAAIKIAAEKRAEYIARKNGIA